MASGRVAHHGAAQGHALALAAGKGFGLAVQQVLNVQHLGGLAHALVNFRLRGFAQLKAESHVFVHRHVRVQRIVLEHHGDVAVFRGHVVHQAVANIQLALGDILQAGNHAQRGRFAAAGRAYQNDEFLIGNFQVEICYRLHIAGVNFVHAFTSNACHAKASLFHFIDAIDGTMFFKYNNIRFLEYLYSILLIYGWDFYAV